MKWIGWKLFLNLWVNTSSRDENIRKTIVIEVNNSCSPTHITGFDTDSGADGEIIVVPFSVVAVEDIRVVGKVCFENVEVPLEIKITDTNSHARLFDSIFTKR